MIDEEKDRQHSRPTNDTSEVKRAMTSEATAETMNLNDEGTEVNAQVAAS